ncbi:MAG TPA: hypothetical protein VMX57_03930 [Planctomycetota bacterium]|nr:hypothetical protein [Planctomycetota bacterium]
MAAILVGVVVFAGFGLASGVTWHESPTNVHARGHMQVDKGFSVLDSAYFNAGVAFGDSVTIEDTLTTDGDGVIMKPGAFSVNADSTVTLTGATTAAGTFTVTGVATFSAGVSFDDTTSVNAEMTIRDSLTLAADALLEKPGSFTVGADSTVTVTGVATFSSGVSFDDTTSVNADITIRETLAVAGVATFSAGVSFDDTTSVNADITIRETLTASSMVTLDSLLTYDFAGLTLMGDGLDGLDTVLTQGVVATDLVIATVADTLCEVRAWTGTDSTFFQAPWTDVPHTINWVIVRPK